MVKYILSAALGLMLSGCAQEKAEEIAPPMAPPLPAAGNAIATPLPVPVAPTAP
jgi:hypothetical protein